MRSRTHTVRRIQARHNREKLRAYNAGAVRVASAEAVEALDRYAALIESSAPAGRRSSTGSARA